MGTNPVYSQFHKGQQPSSGIAIHPAPSVSQLDDVGLVPPDPRGRIWQWQGVCLGVPSQVPAVVGPQPCLAGKTFLELRGMRVYVVGGERSRPQLMAESSQHSSKGSRAWSQALTCIGVLHHSLWRPAPNLHKAPLLQCDQKAAISHNNLASIQTLQEALRRRRKQEARHWYLPTL